MNPDDFLKPAADIVRVPVRVIDGNEEARRSFAGAISDMDDSGELTLVVDIGGGSTELAVGARVRDAEPQVISLPMGSVVMTEEFVQSDPPHAEELSNMFAVVATHFEDAVRQIPEIKNANRLVAVGGTACTVAAVEVGKSWADESQHGFELSRAAMEDVFRTFATETLDDRKFNPGLQPERADVIVGGSAIMAATMRHFDFGSCRISERDLLDSLVDDLISLSSQS